MTDHVLSFLSAYQATLTQAFALPTELSGEYDLFDCLRETPEKSTYLLQRKVDASFVLLKAASGSKREHLQFEFDILRSIHSPLLPQAISCFSDDKTTYFLREYIAGTPVSDFVERQGPFREMDAVRLCLDVCDALMVLHAQNPPVIHRDIKPQNVIYTKQRTLSLIDFDAARRYQNTQKKDTVYLGTQATAAPEQFGYQQTDQRSDIYSTGILLLFLCTGSYELEALETISSRRLKHIIQTCTRFDPHRRYASVRQLRARLLQFTRAVAHAPAPFLKGISLGLCCGIALFAGLYAFGAIPEKPEVPLLQSAVSDPAAFATTENAVITFDSPAFEKIVRQQLGVDDSTPLYQADLDSITSLYLFGTTLLNSWGDVKNCAWYYKPNQAGTITTLSDLPKLHNLTELSLCYQSISDLTPLEGLPLTRLALNGNLIIDLAPVTSIPALQELLVGQNPIYQIDALAANTSLLNVDLNDTYVVDISPLCENLNTLSLKNTPVIDYSPLLKMNSLREVYLSNLSQEDLSILAQITGITTLVLTDSSTNIKSILKLGNLRSLALNDSQLNSIEGIGALEKLTYFRIIASRDIDLSPLTKLPKLAELDIFTQDLSDYSDIFRITSLKTLYCSSAQKEAIDSLGITYTFQTMVLD